MCAETSLGRVTALEEVDAMLGVELDDRLLPIFRIATAKPRAARLAFAILRVDAHHLDVEQLFDRAADVVLGGLRD